ALPPEEAVYHLIVGLDTAVDIPKVAKVPHWLSVVVLVGLVVIAFTETDTPEDVTVHPLIVAVPV
ncbi:MAG: hypothetical protein EBQ94_01220, partial [Flavobacteriales bacterium]|nr:hypothetical protein [Flavobacteriales bacterium]